jgi:hypothetical protein
MPVTTSTVVSCYCDLPDRSDATYVEAVPWQSNLFRLTRVSYWNNNDLATSPIYLDHKQLFDDEKKIILQALVREWNLYSLKSNKKDLVWRKRDMSKKRYWAVCYGTVCRWAGPCETESKAALEAFGYDDVERMTVLPFPGNPKYLSLAKRAAFIDKLSARHEEKTGNKIT